MKCTHETDTHQPNLPFVSRLMALGLLLATTSCSNTLLHELGMKQVKEGPQDQGVSNLKAASSEKPESAPFRTDYLRERDNIINKSLVDATALSGKGELAQAEQLYQQVLTIDADNAQAKLGVAEIERSRKHAEAIAACAEFLSRSEYDAAVSALQPVLLENPKDADALDLLKQINKERYGAIAAGQIPLLGSGYKRPVSLQFRDANLKMIFEAISRASGINILLDKEIKADLKATIFVKEASVEDTISLLLMQNQLEKRVLNENTLYIYPSTPAKLKEYQDLVVRVFQLTNADAKQMQNLLKTVLKVKEIFVNERVNSIVIRDTPEVAELAAKLLASQDVSDPEVMLEVEVLEVSQNKLQQIGMRYPDQVTFSAGASAVDAATGVAKSAGGLTLNALKHLNDSKINVFTGAGSVNLVVDLKKQDGDTEVLASPRIRVKQHEKARIHIGDRVPVITSTYNPTGTTGAVSSSVQYIDVGLKLEVEPEIHPDGEVGIKTGLEVSSISSTITNANSGTTAYQIGTRSANTVLRLRDGETQVLAGLVNAQDMKSAVKVPGLGDIPILGRLFSTHSQDKKKTEIILAITPHIIRNVRQPDADISSYWSGTDSSIRSRPITTERMETIKLETGSVAPVQAVPPSAPQSRPQAAAAPAAQPAAQSTASAPAAVPAVDANPPAAADSAQQPVKQVVPVQVVPQPGLSSVQPVPLAPASIPMIIGPAPRTSAGTSGMSDAAVPAGK